MAPWFTVLLIVVLSKNLFPKFKRFLEGEDTSNQKVMIIGDNNVFEVGTCEAKKSYFKIDFLSN